MNINEVQLATNLAHNATKDDMIAQGYILAEEEMWTGSKDPGEAMYTEKVQELFDEWYDYFYDEIVKCKEA